MPAALDFPALHNCESKSELRLGRTDGKGPTENCFVQQIYFGQNRYSLEKALFCWMSKQDADLHLHIRAAFFAAQKIKQMVKKTKKKTVTVL